MVFLYPREGPTVPSNWHRLRALWGGADRKAFSGDFFFTSLTLLLFWFQLVFCFDDCQNQETVAFYSGLEKSRSTSGKPLWRYFSNRSRRYELFLSSSCLLHWHRFFYVASQLFKTHYCVNCYIRQNLKKLKSRRNFSWDPQLPGFPHIAGFPSHCIAVNFLWCQLVQRWGRSR